MKTINTVLVIAGILLLKSVTLVAQDNDQVMMKQIEHDDQATTDAIAMYPVDTRRDILEAARYPEVIVRLNSMQKQSKDVFTEMLASFNQEEQEKIWNLTRYPTLITELVADHRKSEGEINDILIRYPEEIRKTALEEGIKNYDLLVQIDRSNATYLANMDHILLTYPRVTANAFRNLIKQPDVLSTLFDNMQMTVILGDIYKTDPQYVINETDSLNQVLTQQNAQGAADWQQSLNDNPQAQQEYTQAAEEYAQENGYQPNEYSASMSPDVVNYNTYPYNWWFGYPSWYTTPCWDPYPFWYDWGFYYGPGRRPVFFGMPSSHFMNWYFYNPEHCRRYPEFGNHCYGYYTKHRDTRYSNPVSRGVNDWRRRNKDVVTKDWDKDNSGRTQRFKEYGQLESDRAKYNRSNPERPLERKDYLEKNQGNYPHTTVVAVATSHSTKNKPYERTLPEQQSSPAKPHTKIPDSFYKNDQHAAPAVDSKRNEQSNGKVQMENNQPARTNQTSLPTEQHVNVPAERQNNVTSHTSAPAARPISNQTRAAQQFHQSTWQEVQPQQHYQAPARSEPASRPSSPSPSGGGGGKRR